VHSRPCGWQVGPGGQRTARPRWPQHPPALTGKSSPVVTSSATRPSPTRSSLPPAHADGTGWHSSGRQRAQRRKWRHGGMARRRKRPPEDSPATARVPTPSLHTGELDWLSNRTATSHNARGYARGGTVEQRSPASTRSDVYRAVAAIPRARA
jgi:hypothetical protein